MKKPAVRSVRVLILVAYAPFAGAYIGLCCGKCGGNMPMNIPGGGVPETHEYRLKVSPMRMRMDGLRDGTDGLDAEDLLGMPLMGGAPTGKYMAVPTRMGMEMLNLTVGYSFTDRFFSGLMLMWERNEMEMRLNDMMAAATGRSGFTMHTEGVADTMLMTKYRLFADDPLIPARQVSLPLGLSLPTGSIDERNEDHPVAARQDELQPYGMPLGSGTYDPVVGILYQGSRSPLWWGANLAAVARVHDNDRDYRLGDELRYDLYGMYQVRHDLVLQAQLNGSVQSAIEGEMDEAASGASGRVIPGDPSSPYATPTRDSDNYGGRWLFATVGLQWQPAPRHIIDFQVGMPLHRDLNGPQLETDYRVMLTWYVELPTSKSVRYRGERPNGASRLGF